MFSSQLGIPEVMGPLDSSKFKAIKKGFSPKNLKSENYYLKADFNNF